MADALVSPVVAATAGAISVAAIIVASRQVRNDKREGLPSMMGVLGAFVFAAQMINFTIPGTGSSGHIIGGVLLSAVLGPWAAFLTLCSVLIVQCLVFADGGLMALGCNILNMAVASCLVAYPLVYKPIADSGKPSAARLIVASVAACTIGLELGALLVSVETMLSGITALPFGAFVSVMLGIHLVIGACEGVATGLVLVFVFKNSPSLLSDAPHEPSPRRGRVLAVIGIAALIMCVAFTWIASSNPDGLEWSIQRLAGVTELAPAVTPPTALMPDYESYFAGVIGALIVMAMLWAISAVVFHNRKSAVRRS